MIEIGSGELNATIATLGAEMISLRDGQGRELMTNADPAFWAGHAPLLFPIVGALRDGSYQLDGQRYSMAQHGVARRMAFELVEQSTLHARFRLCDDAATRAAYPFAFRLEADYRIDGAALTMTITATNRDERTMPASFGFHPAFAWPLPFDEPRADHRIQFREPEPDMLCRLEAGLIASEDRPSPVEERELKLTDDLFADDALIWRHARNRGCVYGATAGPQLRLDWSDMPSLGIWTKPGAAFICIEPWDGHADPADFEGELPDKPGMRHIPPGATRTWWMRVTLTQ